MEGGPFRPMVCRTEEALLRTSPAPRFCASRITHLTCPSDFSSRPRYQAGTPHSLQPSVDGESRTVLHPPYRGGSPRLCSACYSVLGTSRGLLASLSPPPQSAINVFHVTLLLSPPSAPTHKTAKLLLSVCRDSASRTGPQGLGS